MKQQISKKWNCMEFWRISLKKQNLFKEPLFVEKNLFCL